MPLTRFKLSSIGDGGITTAKLADGAVTLTKTDSLFVNTEISGTEAARMPNGTTAQRANPKTGDLRFNTSIDQLEQYTADSGWQGISAPPTISSIDLDNFDASDDPQTLVITGQNFDSTASAVLVNSSSQTVAPTTSTRNSSSQITIVFSGSDTITTDAGPYDVKVTNGSGLSAILEDALFLDDTPSWTTAAGTVATAYEYPDGDTQLVDFGTYTDYTISASSSYSGRSPSHIFTGLYGGSDGWANNNGTDEWWKIDMGEAVEVTSWKYYNYDGQSSKTGDFLEASNDDSTWTQISSYGVVTNGLPVSINSATIGTTKYRYWRIRRTWGSSNWGILSGLQIEFKPNSSAYSSSVSTSVTATDPEGETVSYSLTSGALPTGVSLSGNSISGTLDGGNGDYNSSGVTHNFTITADDGTGNTTPRTFNIIRKWYDGSTSANAAINADQIDNIISATSSDDGVYWIKPQGRSAIQVYCEFNSFGGWMLYAQGDGSGVPFPTGTGATGTITTLLGGNKGKHDDDDFNAIDWKYCWVGMTDNDTDGAGNGSGNNTMDANRQLFTTNGLKFRNIWLRAQNQWTGGNTGNGRNQTWSYKGIDGASGSYLTGSARQPSGNVINANGSTDRTINNTNTNGIAPHDAGVGGAWIFASDGTTGGGNFNNGFDSDYDNVSWESRYSYWMFK